MKPINVLSKLAIAFSLIFSNQAWSRSYDDSVETAQVEKHAPQVVSSFISFYRQSKSMDELISKIEGKASPSDFAYLKTLAAELKGQPMPTVQRESGTMMVFSVKGLNIPVEIVSLNERIFKVNRREINFAELGSAKEHFKAISEAFPRQAQHSGKARPFALNLLMPEAHALFFLIPIAAAVATTAITAYELYTTNAYYCTEIMEAANGCKPPLRKMNNLTEDFNKVIEKAAAKKKEAPKCPKYADKEEKDAADEVADEATTALDTLNTKTNSKYAKIIKCDIEWTKAKECRESLDKLAKKLCMNLNKTLDEYTKAADNNAKTGGK